MSLARARMTRDRARRSFAEDSATPNFPHFPTQHHPLSIYRHCPLLSCYQHSSLFSSFAQPIPYLASLHLYITLPPPFPPSPSPFSHHQFVMFLWILSIGLGLLAVSKLSYMILSVVPESKFTSSLLHLRLLLRAVLSCLMTIHTSLTLNSRKLCDSTFR